MKKYLHYLFKKTLLETLVITLVSTLVYVLYILISEPGSLSSPPYETFVLPYVFVFSVVAAFVIATALPILRLHSFKNRSQIDMYYAFPIERKKAFTKPHHYFFITNRYHFYMHVFYRYDRFSHVKNKFI